MDKQDIINIAEEAFQKCKTQSSDEYSEVEKEMFNMGFFASLVVVKEGKIKMEDIAV